MKNLKITTNEILFEPLMGYVEVKFRCRISPDTEELRRKYSNDTFVVEIKRKKENRSLDANAYLWQLCGKISKHKDILLSKEEVYKKAIRDYGESAVVPLRIEQADDIIKWHIKGRIGNQVDVLGDSKLKGYVNVILYFGSSEYDTEQMSHLIDCVVADCKDLGIETMTPLELEVIKNQWGEK